MDIIEEVCKDKSIRTYTKGKFLGKGGFAKCYEFHEGDSIFASKIINKASLTRSRAKQKLMSEIKIHKSLQHTNVVGFHRYFEDTENVYILLELCTNQTMNELLKRRKRLTELEVQCYLMQILMALAYLHKNKIIHRDLKLGNLFLSDRMEIKLGDFGLATQLEYEGERKKTVCGTPNYIAPEILESKYGHSLEVDIWSFGVVAYTLLVGKPPFETSDVKTTYRRIKMNAYSFPENSMISSAAKNLVTKILVTDPSKRLSLSEIKDHEFFHGSIPSLLPLSTLACPPSSQYMRQYSQSQSTSIPKFESTNVEKKMDIRSRPQYASMDRIPIKADICLNQNYILSEPNIFVKKWVDYSSKYGLGYLLNNMQCGVYFNDCSKMLMLSEDQYVYFDRNGEEQQGSLKDINPDLVKKTTLMVHFRGYLLEKEIPKNEYVDAKIYVKKWMKAKHAVIFRLSDKTVQVIFNDNTQMILTQQLKVVTYVDKQLLRATYLLSTALESDNMQMVKRLKYTKEILSQMLGNNQHGNGQNGLQQTLDPKPLQERVNTLTSLSSHQPLYSSTTRLKASLHNK